MQESSQNVRKQLGKRVGESAVRAGNNPDDDMKFWLSGEVNHSGTMLGIQRLMSHQTQDLLPAIATYLCDRQFSNIRYELENPSSALFDEEAEND